MQELDLFLKPIRKSHPNEYYLNQYDTNPAKKLPNVKEGDWVKFSRYVVRVGYKIEPKTYSLDEWNECGFQIIKEETGIDDEKLVLLLNKLNLLSPYKGIRGKIYRKLVHDVRYLKIKQESDKSPQDRPEIINKYSNRHIWLVDLDKEKMGQISDIKRCQTGVYNPKHIGGEYGEDYEPAFLSPAYYHSLYVVCCYGVNYLVHPEDIKL